MVEIQKTSKIIQIAHIFYLFPPPKMCMHHLGDKEIRKQKWKIKCKDTRAGRMPLIRLSSCSGEAHALVPRGPGWKQIRKHRATVWLGFRKPFLFITGILRPLKIRSKTNSSHCWIAVSSWIVWLARFLWLKLMPCLAETMILATGTIWREAEQPGLPDSWVLLNYVSAFVCFPEGWNEMQACHQDSNTALDSVMCKIRVWEKRIPSKEIIGIISGVWEELHENTQIWILHLLNQRVQNIMCDCLAKVTPSLEWKRKRKVGKKRQRGSPMWAPSEPCGAWQPEG